MTLRRGLAALAATSIVLGGGLLVASPASATPSIGPGGVSMAGPLPLLNGASLNYLDQDYTNGVARSAVLAWPETNGANQRWFLQTNSDGTTTLINAASEQCLDQDYTNGVPGRAVIAGACHGGANQKWRLQNNSDGSMTVVNAASGLCLDQDYSNGNPGTSVIASACHGGANQKWY